MQTKQKKTFTLLVHAFVNGTDRSPAMGVDTKFGKLWGRDESHLRQLIRFVFQADAEFADRRLDATPIDRKTMAKYGMKREIASLVSST